VAAARAGGKVVDGLVEIDATLRTTADSAAAAAAVDRVRAAGARGAGAEAKVGGQTAIQQEIRDAAERDRMVIIRSCSGHPARAGLLLRSIVAPLLLVATVVLSFAATLGVGALVFNGVWTFRARTRRCRYAFVFLVALGIDYNIFLMTRVREEAAVDAPGPVRWKRSRSRAA